MLEKFAPLFVIVKQWTAEFKYGHTNVENDLHSKRPKNASTSEIIKKVQDMILEDRQLKICKINAAIGISNDCVIYILHKKLNTKKLCKTDAAFAIS